MIMVALVFIAHQIGGATRDRTADLLRARQALSQLSYSPFVLGLLLLDCVAFIPRGVMYSLVPALLVIKAPCQKQNLSQMLLCVRLNPT